MCKRHFFDKIFIRCLHFHENNKTIFLKTKPLKVKNFHENDSYFLSPQRPLTVRAMGVCLGVTATPRVCPAVPGVFPDHTPRWWARRKVWLAGWVTQTFYLLKLHLCNTNELWENAFFPSSKTPKTYCARLLNLVSESQYKLCHEWYCCRCWLTKVWGNTVILTLYAQLQGR